MKRQLILSAALTLATAAWSQTVKVDEPWVRGTVAGQTATGAFMRLTPDKNTRLVSASSPVAGVTEIHEMAMDNNVMKMRQMPGLALSAGKATELKPGGYHVMLMDLKQAVKPGDTVPITLVFEDADKKRQTMEIKAPVRALGGNAGGAMSHSHGDDAPKGQVHQHGNTKP